MKQVLQSRQASEEEAASYTPPKNRLRASELFSAFETRKSIQSQTQLQEIADEYNIDLDVLERLGQFVNTPSTREESRRKVVDEEGKERFTVLVRLRHNFTKEYLQIFACQVTWEDPLVDNNSPASSRA